MNGRCLCGSVTWLTDTQLRKIRECHCDRCQRTTGNYMAATAVATDQLTIRGNTLTWYTPDDDPNVAYGFCSTCGSSLFYRSGMSDGSNRTTSICAGSLNGPSGLSTSDIWFASSAADHIRFDRDPNPYSPVIHETQPTE